MIAEGRIALNGVTVDTPATLLSTLDGVTVDGDPVAPPEPTRLFLYHKPTGLLVTEHDPPGGRPSTTACPMACRAWCRWGGSTSIRRACCS